MNNVYIYYTYAEHSCTFSTDPTARKPNQPARTTRINRSSLTTPDRSLFNPEPHPSRVSHVRTVEPPSILQNRATAASRSKSSVLPIGVATVMIHRRAASVAISPPSRSTRHGPRLHLRERCHGRSRLRPELLLTAKSSTLELLLINPMLLRCHAEQIEVAL